MEYWIAAFDEAFPIRYVAILAVSFMVLFFAGDQVHTYLEDAAEVAEEIVHVIEPTFSTDKLVPEEYTKVVYAVGQDINRVRLQ